MLKLRAVNGSIRILEAAGLSDVLWKTDLCRPDSITVLEM